MPRNLEIPTTPAPLQKAMLRDSLENPEAGNHVEQVDIVFAGHLAIESVISAWQHTVASVVALRIGLGPAGQQPSLQQSSWAGQINILDEVPKCWESWLDDDRCRPLLIPGEVLWRVAVWPAARRMVWTFHHALLDGRSITRVLRVFLERLAGVGKTETLALSRWQAPTAAAVALAESLFRGIPETLYFRMPRDRAGNDGPAVERLGAGFGADFAKCCLDFQVTMATALTWCWGQAVAKSCRASAVWIEQVRAGVPQPGTAGFTMNTLPVRVRRALDDDPSLSLLEFRETLLALREIESISAGDLAGGVYPDLNTPECSVVMIEHATLLHSLGFPRLIESLVLHEPESDCLTASAHILPDFRLKVEGPGRHSLLASWRETLFSLTCDPL